MSAELDIVANPLGAVQITSTYQDDPALPPIVRFASDWIDFGATGEKEIYQNVKYILLTPYRSVVLDREFGLDFVMVDKPIPIAKLIFPQEVAMKITLYEPRCYFESIEFKEDQVAGYLNPNVKIVITTTNELPSLYPTTTPGFEGVGTPFISPIEETEFRGTLGGTPGPPGQAATVDAGLTITTEPGTDADVINVGDKTNATFDFYIPRGDKGDIGEGIPAYTFSTLDFTIPPVGQTVVIDVVDTSWATIGEFVWVQDADGVGQAGALKIVDIVGNQITLENPYVSEGLEIAYVASRAWNSIGNPSFEVNQQLNGEITITGKRVTDRWFVQGTPSLDGKWKASLIKSPFPAKVPGSRHLVSSKALRIECTTPVPTLDRSDALHIRTIVEGSQSRLMEDETSISLLMMLDAAAPLKFGVTLRDMNQSNTIAILGEVPVNYGTTWAYIRLPKIPRIQTTYDYIYPGVIGYNLDICLAAGSDYISPENDLWIPSNYVGANGQDNFLAANNVLYISFIQHEPGPYCTPFLEKDFNTNLDECYRYFCKSWDYNTVPGTTGPGTWSVFHNATNQGPPDWSCWGNAVFPCPMYGPVTAKVWHHSKGTANAGLLQYGTWQGDVSVHTIGANERAIHSIKGPGQTTAPSQVFFHWTADSNY